MRWQVGEPLCTHLIAQQILLAGVLTEQRIADHEEVRPIIALLTQQGYRAKAIIHNADTVFGFFILLKGGHE